MAYKAQPLHDDLTYTPVRVLDQVERHTRQRAIKFLKVQWLNPSEDEATRDRLRDEYPVLSPSTS